MATLEELENRNRLLLALILRMMRELAMSER